MEAEKKKREMNKTPKKNGDLGCFHNAGSHEMLNNTNAKQAYSCINVCV